MGVFPNFKDYCSFISSLSSILTAEHNVYLKRCVCVAIGCVREVLSICKIISTEKSIEITLKMKLYHY